MRKTTGIKDGIREFKADLSNGIEELGTKFSGLFAATFLTPPSAVRQPALIPVEAYQSRAFVTRQMELGQKVR